MAGFTRPAEISNAAWECTVAWWDTSDDPAVTEDDRLADVLAAARAAALRNAGRPERANFTVRCHPNRPDARHREPVDLAVQIGPGTDRRPVVVAITLRS